MPTRQDARSEAARAERWVARALVAAPDRIFLVLFWVSLVVTVTILLGAFRVWLVAPGAAVLVAATWRLAPRALPATRANVWSAFAALIVAIGWIAANAPFVSRFIVVTRDPGFLTLEGIWLSQHSAPEIPDLSATAVAAAVPGAQAWTGAYFPAHGLLYAQGNKLLPGLLAIAGWVSGERGVMVGNLVIGAVALLSVFALARRVTTSPWAVVPMIALAASIPMVAFSRSAYTEPLALALLFGGLTVGWSALEMRSPWRIGLAGAMVGSTALARIDGGLSVIGFIAAVSLAAAAATLPRPRTMLRRGFGLGVVAAVALMGVGLLDLRIQSPGYLHDLWPQMSSLLAATFAIAFLGSAIALPSFWDPLRRWMLRRRRWIGRALAAGVVAVGLVFLSRPLWATPHHIAAGSVYAGLVGGIQNLEGLTLDPTRSYDEQGMNWLSWYLGWPVVALAVLGLAGIAYRSASRRDPRLLMIALAIGAPSMLYLWRVSITPDQIWAMRRFLPVTIPGFLVAATWSAHWLWASRAFWRRLLSLALGLTFVVVPTLTWGKSLFDDVDQSGRIRQAEAACQGIEAVGADHIVYVRPGGTAYFATLRVICGHDVVEFREPPTQAQLGAVLSAWGPGPVAVLTFAPENVPWSSPALKPWYSGSITTWQITLSHRPRGSGQTTQSMWIGKILPDGSVEPLVPRS